MDNENKLSTLMQLSGSPLQLLRNGGKVGLSGIGRLAGIILLFGFVNLLLLIIALYKQNYAAGGLVLLLGLFCTIYAGKRAYFGIILDLAKFIYQNASPLFRAICEQIVEQAGKVSGNGRVEDIINVKKLIEEKLGKAPAIICKGVSLILKRLPIANMLSDMQNVLATESKERAAALLHQKIDKYVEESIFSKNTISWLFWLLPLNVIVPLVFLIA
jgi:hypothetical protein